MNMFSQSSSRTCGATLLTYSQSLENQPKVIPISTSSLSPLNNHIALGKFGTSSAPLLDFTVSSEISIQLLRNKMMKDLCSEIYFLVSQLQKGYLLFKKNVVINKSAVRHKCEQYKKKSVSIVAFYLHKSVIYSNSVFPNFQQPLVHFSLPVDSP